MHGGKSPGRPVMHGRYTRAAIERWIEVERYGDHVLMEQSV